MVVDRDVAGGEETRRLLHDAGADARFVQADVTVSDDVRRYVQASRDAFGGIHCFFNNAGIEGKIAMTADYEEAVFDAVIAVNLKGVFLGLRHVIPVIAGAGRGCHRQYCVHRPVSRGRLACLPMSPPSTASSVSRARLPANMAGRAFA